MLLPSSTSFFSRPPDVREPVSLCAQHGHIEEARYIYPAKTLSRARSALTTQLLPLKPAIAPEPQRPAVFRDRLCRVCTLPLDGWPTRVSN